MCDSNVTIATTTEENRNSGGERTHSHSWANLQNASQCARVFKHLKGNITDPRYIEIDLDYVEKNAIEKKYATYRETLDNIFGNSTFNLSSVEDHTKCLNFEMNYTTLDNLLILMTRLAANVSESETYDEAYGYAVQIPPLYRERLRHDETRFREMATALRETCGWLNGYAQDTAGNKDKTLKDFEKITDDIDAALRQFNNLNNLFLKLYNDVLNKIEPTIHRGKEYLERNITKVKLAEEFLTPYFTKAVQDLAEISADITDVNKDYNKEMVKGQEKLTLAYKHLFELKLPIINNYNVYKLNLVKAALSVNDTEIRDLFENLEKHVENKMTELITKSFERLMNPTKAFTDPVEDIIKKIESLTQDLKTYKQTATMNTKFYM